MIIANLPIYTMTTPEVRFSALIADMSAMMKNLQSMGRR